MAIRFNPPINTDMRNVTRICTNCNEKYSPRRLKSRRKFCSNTCRLEFSLKTNLRSKIFKCHNCAGVFTPKANDQKFCSQTCSARHNNLIKPRRKKSSRIYQSKAKNYFVIEFKECQRCNVFFVFHHGIKLCLNCRKTDKREYKKLCKFEINPKDYPELYDIDLILKFGWYKPPSTNTPNYSGVTWDHLFSIHQGFALGVDPNVIKHPANAELVPFAENLRRYREQKSTITLDVLYERIQLWDTGVRNLPKFYKMVDPVGAAPTASDM